MTPDLIHSLLTHAWAVFLVVVFFTASIVVHELGHFLAARRCGMRIERFSIGFGPALWSRRDRKGVEYRLSCIPLGGYVALPQLVDLGALEGRTQAPAEPLPPIGYGAKIAVLVAGALFNLLFAFAIACVVWVAGQPEPDDMGTTRIGYVSATLELSDGSSVPGPAFVAGVRPGDRIVAIDGASVSDWTDVRELIATSAGRDAAGRPQILLALQRDGRRLDLVLHPRIGGYDGVRQIGVAAAATPIVYQVAPGSAAAAAGLKPGDEILALGGRRIWSDLSAWEDLQAGASRPDPVVVRRGGRTLTLVVPAGPASRLGLDLAIGFHETHPSPFAQIGEQLTAIFRTLGGLLNPHSSIGLSKISGPIGIAHNLLEDATQAGIGAVLWFTILINVNLAIINLLPLPVLDGGHILFATIGRLRGRALPTDFVAAAQLVFSVLLIAFIFYISVFDVRRWAHDRQMESAAAAAKP